MRYSFSDFKFIMVVLVAIRTCVSRLWSFLQQQDWEGELMIIMNGRLLDWGSFFWDWFCNVLCTLHWGIWNVCLSEWQFKCVIKMGLFITMSFAFNVIIVERRLQMKEICLKSNSSGINIVKKKSVKTVWHIFWLKKKTDVQNSSPKKTIIENWFIHWGFPFHFRRTSVGFIRQRWTFLSRLQEIRM